MPEANIRSCPGSGTARVPAETFTVAAVVISPSVAKRLPLVAGWFGSSTWEANASIP